MKRIVLMIGLCMSLTASMAMAQGNVVWTKAYGGPGADYAHEIYRTSDGGFIIAGDYEDVGYYVNSAYILRLNSDGDTLWTRGFCGGIYDQGFSGVEAPDGGFLFAGRRSGNSNGYPYITRLASNGDSLWTRLYSDSCEGTFSRICCTFDGGFVAVGSIDSFEVGSGNSAYMVKIDGNGNRIWAQTFPVGNLYGLTSIRQTSDSGFVMVGAGGFMGHTTIYLIKTNSLGDTSWTTSFHVGDSDEGYDVVQTADGYIVAGSTFSAAYESVAGLLIKTDPFGNHIWTKTYGHIGAYEIIYSIQATDNGFIAAGSTDYGLFYYQDAWLLKLDNLGDTLWTRTYGLSGNEAAHSLCMASNGDFVLAGYQDDDTTWANVYVIRVSGTAPVGCQYVIGDINGNGVANGIDVGYGVNYFKGNPAPPISCPMCPQPQPFYAGGDVNGNCVFNGIDVTFFVNYLKGIQPALLYCPTCPPASVALTARAGDTSKAEN